MVCQSVKGPTSQSIATLPAKVQRSRSRSWYLRVYLTGTTVAGRRHDVFSPSIVLRGNDVAGVGFAPCLPGWLDVDRQVLRSTEI